MHLLQCCLESDEEEAKMLAFSLGNRSACLYRMEMFQESIDDIQAALSLNYPKESMFKLKERLAKSYLALEETSKVKEVLNCLQQLAKNEQEKKAVEGLIKEATTAGGKKTTQ